MSGHVFPFARRDHDEAQRMLPWLANDTLEAEDRTWVQSHVASCADCRRVLRELHALRAACADRSSPPGDVDAGWRRMRGLLAQERSSPAATTPAAVATRRYAMPRWWAVALSAQVIVLIGLGVVWLGPSRPAVEAPSAKTYRTLGAAPPPGRMTGNLVIVFEPQLAESRMRRLLAASQARIVDGPNEAGAYVLAVPPERVVGVRDALRSAPGVVMVETVAGEGQASP